MSQRQGKECPDIFRAEARLQQKLQLDCFARAGEAYHQGRMEEAEFYAQQGHLHVRLMEEANQRASAQTFWKLNTRLQKNVLDLHGQRVQEALTWLAHILNSKTRELQHGLCRPRLSVITGRGVHSKGGVARIRPAVMEFLTRNNYKFRETDPGFFSVCLQ
ncbi:NEDD4-binding protein 2-like [Aulostomus maculatus]